MVRFGTWSKYLPMIDVLVATLGRLPLGLEHIPWPHRVLTDSRPGWAEAANALLDAAAEAGHDALFLDDDVEILPETFAHFAEYEPWADVFGFRLRAPSGRAISFGYCLMENGHLMPSFDTTRACYLAHVTASVLYIKHAVLAAGVRFPVWPGIHGEDVAFTYDVWLHGFMVAYLPFDAVHHIHESGIGATKAHIEGVGARISENQIHLDAWVNDHEVLAAAKIGRMPFALHHIDGARDV